MSINVRQAIVTKYHGPTNRRDARISATSGSGHHRAYVEIPDNVHADDEEAHHLAAVALCKKLDWPAKLACGALRNGYVFVADASFVLRRLMVAAMNRENVMGDPCRLLECQAELQAAIREAMEALGVRS